MKGGGAGGPGGASLPPECSIFFLRPLPHGSFPKGLDHGLFKTSTAWLELCFGLYFLEPPDKASKMLYHFYVAGNPATS